MSTAFGSENLLKEADRWRARRGSSTTLQEYLLIAQDRMQVEIIRRDRDVQRLDWPEQVLHLESVGFALPMRELYA